MKFWRFFDYNSLRDKVDQKDWSMRTDGGLVYAYYSYDANIVQFPAGILQGVFFNAKNPKYMNFGAIGSLIGHEITGGASNPRKPKTAK